MKENKKNINQYEYPNFMVCALAIHGSVTPLIVTLVGYALFSLDQIEVELQNPFSIHNLSHLPLNDICKTIGQGVMEIQKQASIKGLPE